MAGIHVLSDTLKLGNKIAKTSTLKGKTTVESAKKNAATGFAEVLSSKVNSTADSKGPNSKAGQDSEDKQNIEDSGQSAQNLNGQGSMSGYSNFALPLFTQPMLQSDLPAGKEANSGNDGSQGIENSSIVNSSLSNASVESGNNLELAILNLLSQASDEVSAQSGMTVVKSQVDNHGIAGLDKYKQVIADLLEKLSGEISDISPKGTSLSTENIVTKNLTQDLARIVQGWLMASDDDAQDGQSVSAQTGVAKDNPAQNAKASSLLVALNQLLSKEAEGTKETALLAKVKGILSQELIKGEGTQSSETSEDKVVQNQNSSVGIGLANNIMAANVTDGKTAPIPVFEQIATVCREQLSNGHQTLKELEIQLHPAELGKIQLAMRWENGQVHLQVQASEATTGQLLQNQFSDLRHTLSSQGVNCGTLQMGQGGEQQKNPRGDDPQSKNQSLLPDEPEDKIPVISQLSLGEDGMNQINVTA